MTEQLSSERDLPVVRDTQGSSEIETPSTETALRQKREKKIIKEKKETKPTHGRQITGNDKTGWGS